HDILPALVRGRQRPYRRLLRGRLHRHVRGRIGRGGAATSPRRSGPRGCAASGMNDAELGQALVGAAYLEGDFLLRSGKRSRYYLDKYLFETRADLLSALGERIAVAVGEHEPDAVRLAAPVLGGV